MVELNDKAIERRPATFTVDQDEVAGNLYYFALTGAGKPPYRTQRHVNAILDIADDGTLAGVELIDDMPPPPATLPAPDGLVERLRYRVENPSAWDAFDQGGSDLIAEAATTLQSQAALIERLMRKRVVDLENYTRAWNEKDAQRRRAEQHIQKLTAENERLDANIVRLTGNPIDHRYWEGRYRDEAAENERLREALTPSGETKAAYMGEFCIAIERHVNEDGEADDETEGAPDPYEHISVPWTTIKEIMAAIRARSALEAQDDQK